MECCMYMSNSFEFYGISMTYYENLESAFAVKVVGPWSAIAGIMPTIRRSAMSHLDLRST